MHRYAKPLDRWYPTRIAGAMHGREDGMMVVCPRSTMTSSQPSAGCGPPSGSSRSSRSSATTPEEDLAAPLVESIEGARGMEDPRRMTPEERERAYALLTRALSDPEW
jgi:hypothetical protein